jgi:hypothetical protein
MVIYLINSNTIDDTIWSLNEPDIPQSIHAEPIVPVDVSNHTITEVVESWMLKHILLDMEDDIKINLEKHLKYAFKIKFGLYDLCRLTYHFENSKRANICTDLSNFIPKHDHTGVSYDNSIIRKKHLWSDCETIITCVRDYNSKMIIVKKRKTIKVNLCMLDQASFYRNNRLIVLKNININLIM